MTDKSQCLRKCCWAQSTYKEVSRTQGPHPVRTGVNISGDRCREQSFLHPATNIFEQDWPHCQFSLGQQCYLNWDLQLCLTRASASGWTALARKTEPVWKCQRNACGFWQKTANKNNCINTCFLPTNLKIPSSAEIQAITDLKMQQVRAQKAHPSFSLQRLFLKSGLFGLLSFSHNTPLFFSP